jgi:Flp pilus assembly pilin Flp
VGPAQATETGQFGGWGQIGGASWHRMHRFGYIPPESAAYHERVNPASFAVIFHGSRHMLARRGQGLAEYALILALIAILAITALLFLSGQIQNILTQIGNAL